ncbi:MAG: YitT family protein [Eubacteriales bacterium]
MKKKFFEILAIAFGVFLASVALKVFLIPAKIAAGGVSGLSTIIYYVVGIPPGVSIFALNIPLFILGLKDMGTSFTIKTLFATLAFSALTDLINIDIATNDMFLDTLYGGAFMGLGLGLVIKGGATTGGSDMAAKILNKRFSFISVGMFIFIIDVFVISAAAIVFGPLQSLYAVASLYISSHLVELVTNGLRTGKAFFIISEKAEEVSEAIIKNTNRGATMIYAKGMYTKQERNIVLSVVTNNLEAQRMKNVVKNTDKNAFVITTGVKEVLGQGFIEEVAIEEKKEKKSKSK